MNWYAAQKLAEQHHEGLLREAEAERLARQASNGGRRGVSSGVSVRLRLAFAALAVLLALVVAGPMLSATP